MRRVLLLAASAALLAAALPPAAADDAASTFSYVSPRALKGPVALRVLVDFGARQQCSWRVRTAGLTRRPPILMWEETDGRPAAFFSSYTAQAHTTVAGQPADTRTLVAPGGAWAYDGTAETTFAGVVDYRLVVPDAGSWQNAATGYHPAVRLDIACAGPVTVSAAQASREAVVFKADAMTGGTGATVYQPLGGSVGLVRGDGLRASLTSPAVRLRVTDTVMSSRVEGTLALTAPSGTRTWPLDGDDDVTHDDGPGEYRLTLDRTAAGFSDRFLGVLYGLAPVDDLAEVLGAG